MSETKKHTAPEILRKFFVIRGPRCYCVAYQERSELWGWTTGVVAECRSVAEAKGIRRFLNRKVRRWGDVEESFKKVLDFAKAQV